MIKVRNMRSDKGNSILNQYILTEQYNDGRVKATYFQSYNSIIAKITNTKVYLDEYYWNFSVTTGKYRNKFLGEGIAETREKIKSGEYKLTDLNK